MADNDVKVYTGVVRERDAVCMQWFLKFTVCGLFVLQSLISQ